MAKAKAPKAPPKPKKEKPVKAKKEKVPKAAKQSKAKVVKPRVAKVKVKSDLYTVILMLTFFALATACVFIYLNNSWHQTHL